MDKAEFFKLINENYYEPKTIPYKNLEEMIKTAIPIFGELEIQMEIEVDSGKKTITFIDNESDDVIEMSNVAVILSTDENGIIEIVSNPMGIFTPANKDLVLFLGHLIGKKIEF